MTGVQTCALPIYAVQYSAVNTSPNCTIELQNTLFGLQSVMVRVDDFHSGVNLLTENPVVGPNGNPDDYWEKSFTLDYWRCPYFTFIF